MMAQADLDLKVTGWLQARKRQTFPLKSPPEEVSRGFEPAAFSHGRKAWSTAFSRANEQNRRGKEGMTRGGLVPLQSRPAV